MLFDEVTVVNKSSDELLVVDPQRRTLKDFTYLAHLAYEDDENGVAYVTTLVTTEMGFIVAFRASVVGGRLGQKEPRSSTHRIWSVCCKSITKPTNHTCGQWSNNELICVCDVLQSS